MTSITKADAAMLGRRAEQPARNGDEILAVFVAGKLKNPMNGPQWGRQGIVKGRYRKDWRERVIQVLWESTYAGRNTHPSLWPRAARRVAFLASTHNPMDGDGLQAALKPVRDALVECGVISGDADRDGHVFEYAQRIDRKKRGVEIRVALRKETV
jgi:hypothetical protein